MEQTPNSSSDKKSDGIAGFIKLDLPWIFGRIQEVMFNPHTCWDKIKSEALDAKELFGRYIIPISAASAVCKFIGQSVIGYPQPLGNTYRIPFFSGLIFNIVSLGGFLGSLYLSAVIIEKIAPKFDAQVSRDQALRLVGFAATPCILSGILSLAPSVVLFLLTIFLCFYSVYLLWVGFGPMTGVPENRKVGFFASTTVCNLVALFLIFGVISALFFPIPPSDLQDMQKFQENIQKLIPNPK